MKNKWRIGIQASVLAGTAMLASASNALVLYQEIFPYRDGENQDAEARAQGWWGGNVGDEFGPNSPPTVANQGGEGAISDGCGNSDDSASNAVNSSPQGPACDSFGFWSQTQINANSFFYTTEYTFNSSNLTAIMWDSRNSDNVGGQF